MGLISNAKSLFTYANLNNSSSGDIPSSSSRAQISRGSSEHSSIVTLEMARDEKGDKPWKRKKKMIIGTVIFGLIALAIIAFSVRHKQTDISDLPTDFTSATKMSRNGKSRKNDETVSLRDNLSGKFHPQSRFNGTWISDDGFIYVHYQRGLMMKNLKNEQKTEKLMSAQNWNKLNAYKHQISADKAYLMLQVKSEIVFRRSTLGEYRIYSIKDGEVSTMDAVVLQPSDYTEEKPFRIRHASFSPEGNGVVYVSENNDIYYRRSVMSNDERLTDTGRESEIFNGVPDWVFEEEVFEDSTALWWSPDGQKIVYGSFNDTPVRTVLLKDYGSWKKIDSYPFLEDIAYPKAGTSNPIVQLWLSNFKDQTITQKQIAPPVTLTDKGETHFSGVTFVNNDTFAVQWMNRVQNHTVVTLCKTHGLEDCVEIFENQESDGYVDYKAKYLFDPNWSGEEKTVPDFVTILSDPHTPHRFRQVVLVSGNSRTYLTKLDADAKSLLVWNKQNGYIYYMSPLEGRPRSNHMFRVPGPRVEETKNMEPQCVTCNMATTDDLHKRDCSYFSIEMSKGGSYFSMVCAGPDVPYVCLHETEGHQLIDVYDDNKIIELRLHGATLPSVRYLEVPVPDSTLKAQVSMYLPPNFDPSKKYPTLVYVYGGPGSQMVNDKFDQSSYQTYLAGSKGFIYLIIDPMGSGGQGDKWKFSTYRGFGTAETKSTIEVTKHLQNELAYIDEQKTAIWGWSYGGFLALSVLEHDKENVFRCGASVAPVMDWRLYDTYYTERYMGLPQENIRGYNESRLIWNLEALEEKPFYLMHGTRDDNVHYQNSMLLSAALESKNILFHQTSYPDQDHSISRYQTHLYHTLTDFLLNDCFRKRLTR